MPSSTYRQRLPQTRHLVVKLGTQLLTNSKGLLDVAYLQELARQVAELRRQGRMVTIVSSGAIGAGLAHLEIPQRPRDVAALQAVAAVGQPLLMDHLRRAFAPQGLKVAQLLLTRGDFEDRHRFLNLRNCVGVLQQHGCVPIVNENDTVAVEEIRLGDNDTLAALLCNALFADALVLLSVVDGLLDDQGKVIDLVDDVRQAAEHIQDHKSALGTGGMATKHGAAALVAQAGELAVIANGRSPDVLLRLLAGEKVGTVFAPAPKRLESRLRWIGLTKRPAGAVTVDDGAAAAVRQRGKSLLASGVTAVAGDFEPGAVVAVCDAKGNTLARGLCNYSADELRRIMGKKSTQFEKVLGRPGFTEVIHRNHLLLTAG